MTEPAGPGLQGWQGRQQNGPGVNLELTVVTSRTEHNITIRLTNRFVSFCILDWREPDLDVDMPRLTEDINSSRGKQTHLGCGALQTQGMASR